MLQPERSRQNLRILDLAEEDRPREKLLHKGKSALTDAELLAILIGSGNREKSAVDLAKDILLGASNNLNELARFSIADLIQFPGIGEAKAINIVSALELGRRRKSADFLQKPRIQSAEMAYEVMKPELLDLAHEEFWIIVLNRANYVMKKIKISEGGFSGTVADPKVIFKKALELNGSNMILVHNHPSGSTNPSEQDIKLTRKLFAAGEMLDLPVLDHLIFTDNNYYSFRDNGILL